MPEAHVVRVVRADESTRYNAFFAVGARDHADTLRISPEDIAAAPFSTEPTGDALTFVATTADDAWLGVGSVHREVGRSKRHHIAWVVRMYVQASAAGRGVGRSILRAAIEGARRMPGVSKVNLTVAASNAGAIALYTSEGFRVFATEEDAFRDPAPRTELSMSLRLDG